MENEKKGNGLVIFLLLVLAVGLGIGGFFLGKKQVSPTKCATEVKSEEKQGEKNPESIVTDERSNLVLKKSDLTKVNLFAVESVLNKDSREIKDSLNNQNLLEDDSFKAYFAVTYGSQVFGEFFIDELGYDKDLQHVEAATGAVGIRYEDYKMIYKLIYGTEFNLTPEKVGIGNIVTTSSGFGNAVILATSLPTGGIATVWFEFKESDFQNGEAITNITSEIEEIKVNGKIKVTYKDLGNDVVNITGIYLYE